MTDTAITQMNIDQFYIDDDPVIPEEWKVILEKYSGIPQPDQIAHVRRIREQAWKILRYPCIGCYGFLDRSIARLPSYPQVLEHIKNGATLLDLGCCFGQDLRKLIYDGAPAANLTGSDLKQEFVDLGYDLFRDKDHLNVQFKIGDFFGRETAGLIPESYDYIHCGSFFHLFKWNDQLEAMTKCVHLLRNKPGSSIMGRQVGSKAAGEIQVLHSKEDTLYQHNAVSLSKMVAEVSQRTGVDLKSDVVEREEQRLPGKEGGGLEDRILQQFRIEIV